jgi:hypothetical protein
MQVAEYSFEKYGKTRFILRESNGVAIPDFPAVWVQEDHPHKGMRYVVFTDYWGRQSNLSGRLFTHTLSFGEKSIGLTFAHEHPGKGCGEYFNFEVLVQMSPDEKTLTVQFFR